MNRWIFWRRDRSRAVEARVATALAALDGLPLFLRRDLGLNEWQRRSAAESILDRNLPRSPTF